MFVFNNHALSWVGCGRRRQRYFCTSQASILLHVKCDSILYLRKILRFCCRLIITLMQDVILAQKRGACRRGEKMCAIEEVWQLLFAGRDFICCTPELRLSLALPSPPLVRLSPPTSESTPLFHCLRPACSPPFDVVLPIFLCSPSDLVFATTTLDFAFVVAPFLFLRMMPMISLSFSLIFSTVS